MKAVIKAVCRTVSQLVETVFKESLEEALIRLEPVKSVLKGYRQGRFKHEQICNTHWILDLNNTTFQDLTEVYELKLVKHKFHTIMLTEMKLTSEQMMYMVEKGSLEKPCFQVLWTARATHAEIAEYVLKGYLANKPTSCDYMVMGAEASHLYHYHHIKVMRGLINSSVLQGLEQSNDEIMEACRVGKATRPTAMELLSWGMDIDNMLEYAKDGLVSGTLRIDQCTEFSEIQIQLCWEAGLLLQVTSNFMECPICFIMKECELPCRGEGDKWKHPMCKSCYQNWFYKEKNNTCPICRATLNIPKQSK